MKVQTWCWQYWKPRALAWSSGTWLSLGLQELSPFAAAAPSCSSGCCPAAGTLAVLGTSGGHPPASAGAGAARPLPRLERQPELPVMRASSPHMYVTCLAGVSCQHTEVAHPQLCARCRTAAAKTPRS